MCFLESSDEFLAGSNGFIGGPRTCLYLTWDPPGRSGSSVVPLFPTRIHIATERIVDFLCEKI